MILENQLMFATVLAQNSTISALNNCFSLKRCLVKIWLLPILSRTILPFEDHLTVFIVADVPKKGPASNIIRTAMRIVHTLPALLALEICEVYWPKIPYATVGMECSSAGVP